MYKVIELFSRWDREPRAVKRGQPVQFLFVGERSQEG